MIKQLQAKLRSSLGKDILITLVSQFLIMVLALVVNKLLSNQLGVDGFGQFNIIKKSTSVLSFIMLGGMGIALPRYLSAYLAGNHLDNAKSTLKVSFWMVCILSTVVIVVSVIFMRPLLDIVVGSQDARLYDAALLYAVSMTFSSYLFAYYRGINAFLSFGISQVLVQVILTLGAWWFGASLLLVLQAWSATTLIYVLGAFWVDARKQKLFGIKKTDHSHKVRVVWKALFNYGMTRMLGDFFLFSFAACTLVLINQRLGLAASSFFAVGLTLTSMISPVFSTAGTALLPYMSASTTRNNFRHADKNIQHLFLGFVGISLLAILVLWFGMDVFIRLFFSSDFLPAAAVSKVLLASILFDAVYFLLRNPIDAVSTFPWNTINMFLSVVVLVLTFVFCDTLTEFAIAYLVATATRGLLSMLSWQICRKKILHENR